MAASRSLGLMGLKIMSRDSVTQKVALLHGEQLVLPTEQQAGTPPVHDAQHGDPRRPHLGMLLYALSPICSKQDNTFPMKESPRDSQTHFPNPAPNLKQC